MKTETVFAARLLKLAKFLDSVQQKHFNMGWWGYAIDAECGTVACAAGYATTIPEFQAEGLTAPDAPCTLQPAYGEFCGFHALGAFFGLTMPEAMNIFLATCYPVAGDRISPAMVAAKIRGFVAENLEKTVRAENSAR
jgi:hypothetical protein